MYAIGGRQFDSHLHAAFGLRAKTLNSVECYDCASDSWTKVANLPVGLFAHAGSVFIGWKLKFDRLTIRQKMRRLTWIAHNISHSYKL